MSIKGPPGTQEFFSTLSSEQLVALAKLSKLSDKDQGEAGRVLIREATKSLKALPGSRQTVAQKLETLGTTVVQLGMYPQSALDQVRADIQEKPEEEREPEAVNQMFRFLDRLVVLFSCSEMSRIRPWSQGTPKVLTYPTYPKK